MKKTFVFIAAAAMMLTVSQRANAQFHNEREPASLHLGVRGGLSFNNFTGGGYEDPKVATALTGGVHFDKQISSSPLFLGADLLYVYEGCVMEGGYYINDIHDPDYFANNPDVNRHTFRVPITLSYRLNAAPKVFVSPNAGIFAAYKFDGIHDEYTRDLNFGLRFGCGMNYGRVTFDLAYDLGLAELNDISSRSSIHSSTFLVTVGYNFLGDR